MALSSHYSKLTLLIERLKFLHSGKQDKLEYFGEVCQKDDSELTIERKNFKCLVTSRLFAEISKKTINFKSDLQ